MRTPYLAKLSIDFSIDKVTVCLVVDIDGHPGRPVLARTRPGPLFIGSCLAWPYIPTGHPC